MESVPSRGPATRRHLAAVRAGDDRPGATAASPRAGSPLLGRDEELALLAELLDDALVRLVTLVGGAGVGKSALAGEAISRRLVGDTRVLHVHGTDAPTPEVLPDALVRLLPGDGVVGDPAGALWERLDGHPVLIVVDGDWPAPALADLVRRVLDGYPAARVLATALRPLEVAGERVLRVPPLPPPTSDHDGPAVRLFAERAALADAAFRLTPENAPLVAEVCRLVGGHPLSVRLAAARVRTVPLTTMAAQLATPGGLDLLRAREPERPPRHSTLAAALDWTGRLLSEPAARLLESVSVFRGPFSLDAAAAVSGAGEDPGTSFDLLSELVDLQLVDPLPTPEGRAEWTLPVLVRGWAARRLVASGRQAEVGERHARYIRARCQAEPALARERWPDLVAALDVTVLQGELDEALVLAVLAGDRLESAPGTRAALRAWVEGLSATSTADAATRARAMLWATVHTEPVGQDLAAFGRWTSERLRTATSLARSSGDGSALLQALDLTVRLLAIHVDLPAALGASIEGEALARRLGDEQSLARFELYRALATRHHGEYEQAARLATSSLARARAAQATSTAVRAALVMHGLPREVWPAPDPAPADLEQLLDEAVRLGDLNATTTALWLLAKRDVADRDHPTAVRRLHRMLLLAADRERSQPLGAIAPLAGLVRALVEAGEAADAARVHAALAPAAELLAQTLPPGDVEDFTRAALRLEHLLPLDQRAAVAAEVGQIDLGSANRLGQRVARRFLAEREPVHAPAAAVDSRAAAAPPSGAGPEHALTPREQEVLLALTGGGRNQDVAAELGLSAKTVMHHSVAIYRKLGVRGRAEAVAWAYRSGLVPRASAAVPRPRAGETSR